MTLAITIVSSLLLIVSQVWLVVLAYRRSGSIWAVLMFFFSLISGLVFCVVKKTGWLPWALNMIAWAASVALYLHWI